MSLDDIIGPNEHWKWSDPAPVANGPITQAKMRRFFETLSRRPMPESVDEVIAEAEGILEDGA